MAFILIFIIIFNYIIQYIHMHETEKSYGHIKKAIKGRFRNIYNSNLLLVNHNQSDFEENQINPEKCTVIHIGIVCAGYQANLYFHTMLKSIYFYRSNPLHFHILVNKLSEKVLLNLFETWDVPQVSVTFYDISNLVEEVKWVPNNHYSGIYGLLKLLFHKIISEHIPQLIVLDMDLTFNGDIIDLWNIFKNFNSSQMIGLVDNQSDYYLSKSRWPAIGRGFNTGVILYDLEKLRKRNWDELWNIVAKHTAIKYGETSLADQDIMNAILKEYPELLYQVPCYWNTQLSVNTQSANCYNNHRIKIIHWNSPYKFNVVNKDGDYFRSIYTTFLELNGNLLKRILYDCSGVKNQEESIEEDACSEFHKAKTNKWRTFLFFRKFEYTPLVNDVTFVAQFSYDRLQLLEELCQHWGGPMSLTLYATDPEFQQAMKYLDNLDVVKDRTNIAFHVVFKNGEYHPINILRNVALKHVNTPYVFLADIDFVPMYGLQVIIRENIGKIGNMNKKALIVPAFETQRYKTKFPKSKRELISMWEKKFIHTFRYDVWASGHAPTNYTKWRHSTISYKVNWEPDFEPYIVVSSNVTQYDNRFMGFGWNKVSHIMELEAQSYEFWVLPNAFIIHKPHAPSYDIVQFRKSPTYRM
nr:LARGE xylosyl- and glucuronyltransferase 2-like [Onthophagus taurus]